MPKWDIYAPLTRGILYALIALILCARWTLLLTDGAFSGDQGHVIAMAYNLVHYGVISDASGNRQKKVAVSEESEDSQESLAEGAPRPTNFREPLPAIVPAAIITVAAMFVGPKDLSYFKSGEGARILKISNFFWGAVMCAAVAAAVWVMTGVTFLAAVGALLAGWPLNVDLRLAESPAAALIALASLFLMLAIKHGRARDFILAGLAFGALILTKGAFQYITLALFVGLTAWLLVSALRARAPAGPAVRNSAVFALAALVIVGPWAARNYIYLGTPQITQRGGEVLMIRAVKNAMTDAEAVGTIYAWAPRSLKKVIGWGLGYGPEDLKKGGRLQRLNRDASDFSEADKAAEKAGRPENAISYYRKAQALRIRLKMDLKTQGVANRKTVADDLLQSRAMAMILADPWRHLAMTPLFLWRGAAQEVPFLVLVAILALWRRRGDLLAYVIPSLLMIAFYALVTHNIPRYNNPCFPIVVAGLLAASYPWLLALSARFRSVAPNLPTSRQVK